MRVRESTSGFLRTTQHLRNIAEYVLAFEFLGEVALRLQPRVSPTQTLVVVVSGIVRAGNLACLYEYEMAAVAQRLQHVAEFVLAFVFLGKASLHFTALGESVFRA